MKIDAKLIKQIGEELEAGMKVYLNKQTLEIKTILDWDDLIEYEFWEKEEDNILNEWSDYIVFTKMEPREAFRVMEEFAQKVEDSDFRERLETILARKSPFANFKAEVESSPYRQNWFDFRLAKYMEYVRDQLEFEEFDTEE
jgi:hypothetical protein